MIRIIDRREEEKKYVKKKFGYKADFIDIEARNSFQTNKIIISIIKCAHRYNHYSLRDVMINENMVEANCPWCNQIEMWDYVIKCGIIK